MESKKSKQEQFKDIIKLIESKNYNEAKNHLNNLLDQKKKWFLCLSTFRNNFPIHWKSRGIDL